MTHDELVQFVQAVNRALPDDMELCIELLDKMRGVAHFRMEQEGKPTLVSIPLGSLEAMAKDPTAAAVHLTKLSG